MKKVSSCYTDHCFNKIIEGFKKWRGIKDDVFKVYLINCLLVMNK